MKGRQHHRRIIIFICCNGVVAGSQSLFDCRSNRSSFMPACSPGIFPLPSRAWKSSEDYTTIQICKASFTLPPEQETSSLHQASVGDTSSHVFCCPYEGVTAASLQAGLLPLVLYACVANFMFQEVRNRSFVEVVGVFLTRFLFLPFFEDAASRVSAVETLL